MDIPAIIATAAAAAKVIPADRDALSCALEFCEAYLPDHAEKRREKSYSKPSWLEFKWNLGEEAVEELIDGKWRPVNALWIGLPGDKEDDLEIMASLREVAKQTARDLSQAGYGTPEYIRNRLSYLERAGFVTSTSKKPKQWALSRGVLDGNIR